CAQEWIRVRQVASLSHAIADSVERIGHIWVLRRKKLLPHLEGFPLQRFRLLQFAIATGGPGKIDECPRNRCMFRAKQPSAHREDLPRRRFGFGPLASLAQNNNQVAERVSHLPAFVSQQFLPRRQRLASQCFCLRESPGLCTYMSQIILRNGHLRILVAEVSPPDFECFTVYLRSLRQFSARDKRQAQIV